MTIANQLISFRLSGVTYAGTSQEFNYTSGVVAGVASPSKSIILDSSKSAGGINQLSLQTISAQNISGTITTGSQPNITSLGSLSNLSSKGIVNVVDHNGTDKGLQLGGVLVTSTAQKLNYVDTTPGSASASKAIVLDGTKNISGITSLQSTTLQCTQLSINGTYLNVPVSKLSYVDITEGVAQASKALVLDSSKTISGISNISTDTCTISSSNSNILVVENKTIDGQANILFKANTAQWEVGVKGPNTGNTSGAYYVYKDSYRFMIKPDGKIGINNGNPLYQLDVNGDVSLSGNIRNGSTLLMNSSGVLQNASQSNITSLGTLTSLTIAGSVQAQGITCTGITIGSTTVSSTASELNTLSGITAGTAIGNKALIVNAQRNISSLNQVQTDTLTATSITGTITTANQSNITRVGTLSGLSSSGAITTSINNNSTDLANFAQWANLASTNVVMSVDMNNTFGRIGTSSSHPFRIMANNSNVISVEANGGVNINSTTQNNYKLNVNGSVNVGSLSINQSLVSVSASELNVLGGVTPGSAKAGKVLAVDSQFNIDSINQIKTSSLVATTISGVLSTSSQPNITSLGTLGSLSISAPVSTVNLSLISTPSSGRANISFTNNSRSIELGLKGTSDSSPANTFYIYDPSSDTFLLNIGATGNVSLSGNTTNYKLNVPGSVNMQQLHINQTQVMSTAVELNYLSQVNIGNAQASKALVLDSSKNINGIASLSATTLTGTLQTTSQPNITSIGTLSSLSLSGSINGVNNIQMSGFISGAVSVSATALTGTLQTSDQPNITSVGTLSGMKISGNVKVGVVSNTANDLVHIESSSSSKIGLQIENKNTTAGSGTYIKFSGFCNGISNYDLASITCGYVSANQAYGYGFLAFATRNNNLSPSATERVRITQDGDVGIGTTTPNYKLHVAGSLNATSLYINQTQVSTSASELNYLSGLTIGTAQASKSLVLDSSKNISGIASLSATTLTGTLQTPSQTNITSVGTLNGVRVSPTNTSVVVGSTTYDIPNLLWMSTSDKLWGMNQPSSNILNLGRADGNSWYDFMTFKHPYYVGIGCNPKCKLHLGATTGDYLLALYNQSASSSEFYGWGVNSNYLYHHSTSGHKFFYASEDDTLGTLSATLSSTGLVLENGLTVGSNSGDGGGGCIYQHSSNTSALTSTSATSAYNIYVRNNNTASGEISGIAFLNDVQNVGSTTPTCAIRAIRSGTGGSGGISFATKGGTLSNDACSTKMVILGNGNVGIGNANPNYTADINGVTRVGTLLVGSSTETGNSVLISALRQMTSNNDALIAFGSANSSANRGELTFRYIASGDSVNNFVNIGLQSSQYRLRVHGDGKVGIGASATFTPNSVLHIDQHGSPTNSVQIDYDSDNSTYKVGLGCTSNGKLYVSNGMCVGTTTSTGYGYVYIAGVESVSISGYAYNTSDNIVGYNENTSASFNCSLRTSNRIVAGAEIDIVSDRRIKENIYDLTEDYCIDFISKVSPKRFNYKKNPKKVNHGFIAQELYKAGFGDLVSISYQPGVDREVDDDGFISPQDHIFTVSMEEIIPILTKSTQMLKKENENLKKRLDALEKLIMEKLT